MTKETGEQDAQPLLPVVSGQTINDALVFTLEDLERASQSDSPTFVYLLGRGNSGFFGGFLVDRLLKAEAFKQKMDISEPSSETIAEYEAMKEIERRQYIEELGLPRELKIPADALRAFQRIQEHEAREGSSEIAAFARYKNENPNLMDFLAFDMLRMLYAFFNEAEMGSVQAGALTAYEIFRLQAQRTKEQAPSLGNN